MNVIKLFRSFFHEEKHEDVSNSQQDEILAAVDSNGNNFAHTLLLEKQHQNRCLKESIEYLISLAQAPTLFKNANQEGKTPLHLWLALKNEIPDPQTFKKILGISRQDINARDKDGQTMFLTAAARGDSMAVLECLKDAGADHTVTNNTGFNALHISAANGFFESVKYFVSIRVGLEQRTQKFNFTPLHVAAYYLQLDVLKYLITQNANVLAVDKDGNNIAHLLLISKRDNKSSLLLCMEHLVSLPKVGHLFKMTNNQGRTPVNTWIASDIQLPDSATIEKILKLSEEDINATDSNGYTMFLMAATKKNSQACLKTLHDLGADHCVYDNDGSNALHLTAEGGTPEYVKYLVSIGVPLEQQDNLGNTPILRAAYCRQIDVIKYLVGETSNVLAVNYDGNNVAHALLRKPHDWIYTCNSIIEYLISLPQGSRLFKMLNNLNRTPLHHWIAAGKLLPDSSTVKLVLAKCRLNINAIDVLGATMFLNAAKKEDSVKCLVTLKKLGAKVTATDHDGKNALQYSALYGYLDTAEYLLSVGVPLENRDKDDYTPLLLAAICKQLTIVDYFIKKSANVLAVNKYGNNVAHLLLQQKHHDTLVLQNAILNLISGPQASTIFKMKNEDGQTPLQVWISSSFNLLPNGEAIKRLLEKLEKDINTGNVGGYMMYLKEVQKQDFLKCLKSLRDLGIVLEDVGHEIILAVDNCGENIAHKLLGKNHDDANALKESVKYLISIPQGPDLFRMTNKRKQTPLHKWFKSDNIPPDRETFAMLLQKSEVDVNAADEDGKTMFFIAVEQQVSLECVKYLLDLGADHKVTNSIKRNALHISAQAGNLELVQHFVSIGIPVDGRDKFGYTPIHLAADFKRLNVIKYLVAQQANVLAVTNCGDNIAHLLRSPWGDKTTLQECIKYLLSLPQRVQLFNMKNRDGEIPRLYRNGCKLRFSPYAE